MAPTKGSRRRRPAGLVPGRRAVRARRGAAYLVLEGRRVEARRARSRRSGRHWVLALLIAIGIGLHNFGEGLAIGSAFALGEAALGTLLIVGFTLHNTTEGLAIVAPLARAASRAGGRSAEAGADRRRADDRRRVAGRVRLFPVWSVLFLALGVGAIAQVAVQIAAADRPATANAPAPSRPAGAGRAAAGFAVMYVTGMLVG